MAPVDNTLVGQLKVPHGNQIEQTLEDYVSGVLTAATLKKEWIISQYYRIVQVLVDSETANVGAGPDRIDINVNGTSIYSATADKPVLQSGDTGKWTASDQPVLQDLVPGDIVSYDVDNVGGTTGSARVKLAIMLAAR